MALATQLREFAESIPDKTRFRTYRGLKYHLNKLFDDTDSSTNQHGSSDPYDTSSDGSDNSAHSSNRSSNTNLDINNDIGHADVPQAMESDLDIDGVVLANDDQNDGAFPV